MKSQKLVLAIIVAISLMVFVGLTIDVVNSQPGSVGKKPYREFDWRDFG